MKKKVKKIFIIIAVVCFFLLFFSNPRTASAVGGSDYTEKAYQVTSNYFEWIETNQQAVLEQFFTYAYVSVVISNTNTTRDYCLVISSAIQYSDHVYYQCSLLGSGYYISGHTGFIPATSTLYVSVYQDYIIISGTYYYFDPVDHIRYVTYCDLPTTYYNNHTDPLSLQSIIIPFNLPAPSIDIPKTGTFEDIIKDDLERWNPQSTTTTTSPPFVPPATLPPATLPPDILTIYPPVTDLDGSYVIDYQPYIYGGFTPITTMQDNTIISSSGSIIAYSWSLLTADEQIKSIILLILALSLVLGLLT